MNRRILSVAVLVVSSLCTSQAMFAAPAALPVSVHAMFGKTKMVAFNLRNDTAAPLKLKTGENVVTIGAGKTMNLKLPSGTSVTTEEATATLAAGTVIAQVTSELSGVTISVK